MKLGKEEEEKERKRFLERKRVFGIGRDKVSETKFKLYIEDEKLGFCGVIDTLLILKNGDVIPVEIKYTNSADVKKHWKKQLTGYSMLLEKEFDFSVSRGMIYFPEQNETIFVDIKKQDKEHLKKDIKRIRELIKSERIPRKVSEKKCSYCEVKKYCV